MTVLSQEDPYVRLKGLMADGLMKESARAEKLTRDILKQNRDFHSLWAYKAQIVNRYYALREEYIARVGAMPRTTLPAEEAAI